LRYLSPAYDLSATLAAMRLPWFEPYYPPGDFNGRGVRGGRASLSQVVESPGAPEAAVRDDLRATAFFVANVPTDSDGLATIRASLPHGITRYRVFAVAADTLGRTGRDTSSLQVTMPLVVRAALPRFVRPGDAFSAGAAVAVADGVRRAVRVDASAAGLITRDSIRDFTAETKAREVRFAWVVPARDSNPAADTAQLLLRATASDIGDAVRVRLPVTDARRPLVVSRGVPLGAERRISLRLPADVDLARSQVQLRVGHPARTATDVALARARREPYDGLEPIASHLRILTALYRIDAYRTDAAALRASAERLATRLTQRLNRDGSVRYWPSSAWTTPWLSAYAGVVLREAQAAGIPVDSSALGSLRRYLAAATFDSVSFAYGAATERSARVARALTSDLARAQFLRRMEAPDSTLEAALQAQAEALPWEALPTLADLLLRAGRRDDAIAMMERAWSFVHTNSGSLRLPEPRTGADISSLLRGPAGLIAITRTLRPMHPLLPALEAQVIQGALGGTSTHDLAEVVATFASDVAKAPQAEAHRVVVTRGDGSQRVDTLMAGLAPSGAQQWSDASRTLALPLARYVRRVGDSLDLSLRISSVDAPYAQLTVFAEPPIATQRPLNAGMTVERWIERIRDGSPTTELAAGDLVRVVLRVRTDASRAFVVLEDALPAGLEVIDPSLRTTLPWSELSAARRAPSPEDDAPDDVADLVGTARGVRWPVWMHRELRDDVVRFHARLLWPGTHTVSYLARATTPGRFARPSAYAEEMFDAGVHGRSEAGALVIRAPITPP
jgi:alpha-2-macroglobulin